MSMVILTALFFASCNDVMDDKSVIDAGFEKYVAPEMTLSAEAVDFQSIVATLNISNVDAIVEQGLCVNGEFLPSKDLSPEIVYNEDGSSVAKFTIKDLEEKTEYTIKPYVVTKSSEIVVSDKTVKVVTPAMPVITIEGTYTTTEYELDDNDVFQPEAETYTMEIKFTDETEEEVAITNFWGYEGTVFGMYDKESGVILVPTAQVIGEHPNYGSIWMYGVNESISGYTDAITLTPNGFNFTSSIWQARVEAGVFGYYYVQMKRNF